MSPWYFISSRYGAISLSVGYLFSTLMLIRLIYINKDYSGFDGVANLSSRVFGLGQTRHESSCVSREASIFYRKPSPYKPSPYLLSKLRHHKTLFRQCGPITRSYRRTINAVVKSEVHNVTMNISECSYIIWRPNAAGLGNQMVSMVSTFLYALLTNRVLLVELGPTLANLFCEPFIIDHTHDDSPSWILQKDFPFRLDDGFRQLQTFETLMNETMRTNNNSSPTPPPNILYVNLLGGSFDRVNYFHCNEAHKLLKKIPVLVAESDLYYVPSLFMTPSFTEELEKMFPERATVFHHLGRYLFHPSDMAWNHITNYYDAHLAKADVKLGLQIRIVVEDIISSNHETVMDQILNCTQKYGILPPPPPPIETNNTTTTTRVIPSSSTAILITSLYPDFAKNLSSMYGESRPPSHGEVIRVYQPSSDGQQRMNDTEQNMNAWVEMYLLSLCDKLVTTGESTFGYVAEGLAGLRPWVLRKPDKDTNKNVACWRAPTMDPCFEFPPRFDCNTRREVDDFVSEMFLNKIKRCEDRWVGIRLIDGSGL